MNVIEFLRERTNDFLTIQKYDFTDLATSHHIRFLIDNTALIIDYFDRNILDTLDNEEQFYDYLYLKYIEKFDEQINEIPEEYRNPLCKIIKYSKGILPLINNGHIIRCIQTNYVRIFELSGRLNDRGLMNETLDLMIRFYSGLKDCGVFQYMISEHTYFAFDKFEDLFDILKKNNQDFLRLIMIENLSKISQMRFRNICEVIKKLYHNNFPAIAQESGLILYKSIIERYKQMEDEYSLQVDLKLTYDTLYFCKLDEAKELIKIIREINEKVDKRILETGHEFKYKFSTEPYVKWMEENKNVVPISRYLTITHEMNEEEIWVSNLIKSSEQFMPSFTDILASASNTNDYFTISRKNQTDIHITVNSTKLGYWFGEDDLANEFNQSLKTAIDAIFEIVDYDTEFEELRHNIDNVTSILREAVKENESGIKLFNKLMFIISFLEKVLRLVNIAKDDRIFFERNITLGSLFGKGLNYNPVMLKVLGEHHLRWSRYYLLKDDEKVGLEYRNRIAHMRDINPNEMDIFEFFKVVWIVLSTLNSIMVNLINDTTSIEEVAKRDGSF